VSVGGVRSLWTVILSRVDGEGPPYGSQITHVSSSYIVSGAFVAREAFLVWHFLRLWGPSPSAARDDTLFHNAYLSQQGSG